MCPCALWEAIFGTTSAGVDQLPPGDARGCLAPAPVDVFNDTSLVG